MPRGTFAFYTTDCFPQRPNIFTTKKRRPPGSKDWQSAAVFTRIELLRKSPQGGFRQVTFLHREGMKLDGEFHGQEVHELVAIYPFLAYYQPKKQLLIVNAKKHIVKAALTRLSKELPDQFHFKSIILDIKRVRQAIGSNPNIVGAWFSQETDAHIHSQAVFGETMEKDAEFKKLSNHAQISGLRMSVPFESIPLKVSISRHGSVFFSGDYPLGVCLRFIDLIHEFALTKPIKRLRSQKPYSAEKDL